MVQANSSFTTRIYYRIAEQAGLVGPSSGPSSPLKQGRPRAHRIASRGFWNVCTEGHTTAQGRDVSYPVSAAPAGSVPTFGLGLCGATVPFCSRPPPAPRRRSVWFRPGKDPFPPPADPGGASRAPRLNAGLRGARSRWRHRGALGPRAPCGRARAAPARPRPRRARARPSRSANGSRRWAGGRSRGRAPLRAAGRIRSRKFRRCRRFAG